MTPEDEELEKLIKEIEIEKPKEEEKAKPERKEDWADEESNITEKEYNDLGKKDKENYGI